MKSCLIISAWIICFFNVASTHGQSQIKNVSSKDTVIYESKNGYFLTCHGTIRLLVVLVEIDWDVTKDPNEYVTWPQGSLPPWINNFVDVKKPGNGLLSQYFNMASSGNYVLLGDYLTPPGNGGVIRVKESEIIAASSGQSKINGYTKALVNAINAQMKNGFTTRSGITDLNQFDHWTPTGNGLPKTNRGNSAFDHVMIIWRNFSMPNGTGNAHPYGNLGTILSHNTDSWSQFAAQDGMPLAIARHEYTHLFMGGNNFHVSGGEEPNMWIGKNSAHSMLSLYGATLECWNAWDRQRLGWKAKKNKHLISARNTKGKKEVPGDLDATNPSHAGIYTLRDFITTGDAIRIKLPFLPSSIIQEYIWLENHNGKSINKVPFDEYKYAGDKSCVAPATYGLYAYLQIGKDVNSEINRISNLYGDHSDYIRYISADGFYDVILENDSVTNRCWPPPIRAFSKQAPNPLTGSCDLDDISVDLNSDGVLKFHDKYPHIYENANGVYQYDIFQGGNARQVFTLSGTKKLGIGYNPTCASMINLPGMESPMNNSRNARVVYLNGVSIEILSQSKGTIQIKIRFDDVDIVNDARWCAPEIQLNPISTPTGFSLNITSGHKLTLDQGLTATNMNTPMTFNGQILFTDTTIFKCNPNSFINLESNSELIVDNNSQLILEANSRIDIQPGAILRVKRGGKLIVHSRAVINSQEGSIVIEPDGTKEYFSD